MVEPIQSGDKFTPQALSRWKKIPEWAQKKILDNVFCSRCIGSVTILLETADIVRCKKVYTGCEPEIT